MMQPCSSSPAPVVFIGLDCVPLGLLERLRPKMPHMDSLLRQAAYGPLRSSTPPITVPAWASMLSGRDAGELGMYGFRSKVPGAYAMRLHDARDMQHKRVWDWAAETGKRVAVVSVPLTWPPPAVRGQLVSSLLWPGKDAAWTHPPDLAQALEAVHGPYRADIDDFRREDSEAIWPALHSALRQHFAIARDLWQNARPDLLLLVILATDRLHHRFWHRLDPAHPRYIPDHPDNARAEAFYQALDAE
ncbi:MAG: alkaline phosphatase family protein, partial [Polyangiales bacterium]